MEGGVEGVGDVRGRSEVDTVLLYMKFSQKMYARWMDVLTIYFSS